MQMSNDELEIEGYSKRYDYTQYSHDNHVNVIPEKDFKHLVIDTFRTITETLQETYGPYGSSVVISCMNETTTTKDGYNIYSSIGFSHQYKNMIYRAILKICDRVNRTVGDGTTSCILMAEQIFDRINHIVNTPETKRKILNVLTEIENDLQNSSKILVDKEQGEYVKPLTMESLKNIISLASNYDENLTDTLVSALDPETNDKGEITNVRNVVVDVSSDYRSDFPEYTVTHLPGDYRVRIDIDSDKWWVFSRPSVFKIALYDHAFGSVQWDDFMDGYKGEATLILVANTTQKFLDTQYTKYMLDHMRANKPINVFIAKVKGTYVQTEIRDLAALLGTRPIELGDGPIDHSTLPSATISVHEGNALCVYNAKVPTEYIDLLKQERDNDKSKSLIGMNVYEERIHALSLESKDTCLKVHSMSTLESKMIADKIDDCISIVNSGLKFGCVPNMFAYGKIRIQRLYNDDPLMNQICEVIDESILSLFDLIRKSKYEKLEDCPIEYSTEYQSVNIITDQYVPLEMLPTSAQYDMEVISAAISILKYLITSRAFIFDANLMQSHGDQGHYEKM